MCTGSHARGLSILGVLICVLILTGSSCSSTAGMTDVSKGVSTTYTVEGYVRCDHNDNFYWVDDSDHFEGSGVYVWYQIEGGSTTYTTTDASGYYKIDRGDNLYVDVWLVPNSFFPDWRSYYEDLGSTGGSTRNPTIRVPANQNRALSFAGSDKP